MASNISDFVTNVTINQVIEYFNLSDTALAKLNITNETEMFKKHLFNLYEDYKTKEKEQFMTYKLLACIFGSLIVLSNSIVVVSSGLILRKGQQPKGTYLLLGNVSLADTMIGISILFCATVNKSMSLDPLCIFQIGMLVTPALVSIFSVGLIAVDRYIYILHGLYYRRWFNATRVRIGILCIWMVATTLGFMPVTGWVNEEFITTRCLYVTVFPGALIIFNSILTFIPFIVVATLYIIILKRALKNFRQIKASEQYISADKNSNEEPKLRICRGTSKKIRNNNSEVDINAFHLKRSVSFDTNYGIERSCKKQRNIPLRAKSVDDLTTVNTNTFEYRFVDESINCQIQKNLNRSKYSICTVESNCSDRNIFNHIKISNLKKSFKNKINYKKSKSRKLRAVSIVMLTSGSFIFTLSPYFVIVIFYVFCEEKVTNPQCMNLNTILNGPLMALGYMNSLLNPLIYAWWHKGFKASVRIYYRRCIRRYFNRNKL